jgi:hypothetical protein
VTNTTKPPDFRPSRRHRFAAHFVHGFEAFTAKPYI